MRVLMVLCALVAAPFVAGVSQGGHDAQQCWSDWHAQHQTHANNGKHLGWAKQVVPCPPSAQPPPNQPPTASFSASCNGLSCGFTDASSDLDGLVASWSWAFGDAGTATTQSVSHAYGAAGTYTVQLTVTDNQGATGTTSQSVTVTAPSPTNSVDGRVYSASTGVGIAGWSVELSGMVGATGAAFSATVQTGPDGSYVFSGLPDGSFTVCQGTGPGGASPAQVFPTRGPTCTFGPGFGPYPLAGGQGASWNNFGNTP